MCNYYGLDIRIFPFGKLGHFVASKLEMEPDEKTIFICVLREYKGYMIFAFENGKVSITFAESPPDGYEYLVEREENGKKCVVYRGKPTEIFIDEVEKGKSYDCTDWGGYVVCIFSDTGEDPTAGVV